MNDKMKFYEMTKPMKFRRLKLAKKYVNHWCKALRELIQYSFNNILYHLKILKRYSYRDNMEMVIPAPHDLKMKSITSDYFGGNVIMQLISSKDIDVDYFYREKKDGSRKITLCLKDHTEERLFVDSHLDNIHIKVGDQWYDVEHLPVFKVASIIKPEPVEFTNLEFIEKPTEPKVVEYDIMKLRTLRHRLLLGTMSLSDISKAMYDYYYDCSCGEFEKHLNTLELADILR